MVLDALLFDVDGTLADTEAKGHLPAYNRAFRELGLDWRWTRALYRRLLLVSGGRERIEHYLEAYEPTLGAHGERVSRDRQAWIEEVHRSKAKHFSQRLEEGRVPLRPGVARLLGEAARAGLRMAIVTNASRATLDSFVAHALGDDLRRYIELTICGDEIARKKPAPDLYCAACERLGCLPRECIAIEDSAAGVSAADAAGVPVVMTVNADTRKHAFGGARAVVDSLGEPTQAVRVLKSPGFEFDHVDLAVLRRIHAQAQADYRSRTAARESGRAP